MTEQERKHWHSRYLQHRHNAKNRVDKNGSPIEFFLTFEDWLSIWQDSGKLSERGNKRGQYVMARRHDLGHYTKDNVDIIQTTLNVSVGNLGKVSTRRGVPRSAETKQRISNSLKQKHDCNS